MLRKGPDLLLALAAKSHSGDASHRRAITQSGSMPFYGKACSFQNQGKNGENQEIHTKDTESAWYYTYIYIYIFTLLEGLALDPILFKTLHTSNAATAAGHSPCNPLRQGLQIHIAGSINNPRQDSWIAAESGTKSLLAVLDGHGEQGSGAA